MESDPIDSTLKKPVAETSPNPANPKSRNPFSQSAAKADAVVAK